MAVTVKLKDILDAFEMLNDEYPSFVNLDTGKVEAAFPLELLREVEDSDEEEDEPDSGEPDEEWELAKAIAFSGRFRKLPTRYDIDEWRMMADFTESVRSVRIRDDLEYAIHGAGAFRSFRHVIRRHGVESAWLSFREEALRKIAMRWCEDYDLEWE